MNVAKRTLRDVLDRQSGAAHGRRMPQQADTYNLRIEGPPKDARYYMSTVPAMPVIVLTAKVDNVPMPHLLTYNWLITLVYDSYIVTTPGQRTYQVRTKTHPPLPPMTGQQVTVPLTSLMCGRLTATVSTTIQGQFRTVTRKDILIGGTNPSSGELAGVVPEVIVRKLIKHESTSRQFYDSGVGGVVTQAINPNWSQDNLKGVGLGQLTNPAPSDADIWNWRQNALSLQSRFKSNRTSANGLATSIQNSTRFKNEVAALNAWRQAEGQPALNVTVPALTTEQRDWAALRRYNGLGPEVEGQYLSRIHEFEPEMTQYTSARRKAANGTPLTATLLSVGAGGAIVWHQITGAERSKRYSDAGKTKGLGDPNYVANVLAKTP
jgi:hypothetical protein